MIVLYLFIRFLVYLLTIGPHKISGYVKGRKEQKIHTRNLFKTNFIILTLYFAQFSISIKVRHDHEFLVFYIGNLWIKDAVLLLLIAMTLCHYLKSKPKG